MKVIQYNIHFGEIPGIDINERIKNVSKVILEECADVICLQEVLDDQYKCMIDFFKNSYPYFYPEKVMKNRYGTVIISKYPHIEHMQYYYSNSQMGRDLKIIRIKNDEDTEVYICTTHFESEFNVIDTKLSQYDECSKILRVLRRNSKIPIILCADTNICKRSEYQFNNIFDSENDWIDSWIENGAFKNNEYTFDTGTNPVSIKKNGDGTRRRFRTRLDRIIHSTDLTCVKLELIGTKKDTLLSDHYGILATFPEKKSHCSDTYQIKERKYVERTTKIINQKSMFDKKLFKKV
jgi:endonuclease/exonuclease/phosphatase family metal-dependent hydrolase